MNNKVLLVDDDKVTLSMISNILEGEGFDIISSTTPINVMDLLNENIVDAILLDISMPEISGIDLCKTIKSHDQFKSIPVLFLTSYNEIDLIKEAFNSGACDFIIKPFDKIDLSLRLNTRIDNYKKINKISKQKDEYLLEIESLKDELKKLTTHIHIDEEWFENKESKFLNTDKKIQENKNLINHFNDKLLKMQENLQRQEDFINSTKELLNKSMA